MDLKFTPRLINEIEVESKKPVQDVLADFSLRTMVLFVKKGLSLDEDKAFKAIETFLADGKDTVGLYTLIMEKLQEAGFLPRKLNLKKVKTDMSEAIEKGV